MAESYKKSVDPTFVVLGVTALAYACGFAFECAYLMYFGVPLELVQVEVRSILSCAGAISLVLTVYHLLDPLPKLWWMIPAKYRSAFGVPVVLLALVWVMATVIPYKPLWLGLVAPIYNIVATSVKARMQLPSSWSERFQSLHLEREFASKTTNEQSPTATQYIKDKTGHNPMPLVLFAGFAVLLAYVAGQIVAHEKRTFLVKLGTPSCAVLTTYGSIAICGDFEGQSMLGSIKTFELSVDKELHLIRLAGMARYKSQTLRQVR